MRKFLLLFAALACLSAPKAMAQSLAAPSPNAYAVGFGFGSIVSSGANSLCGGSTTEFIRGDGTCVVPSAGGSPAFSAITPGTNTGALLMGSGGSFGPTGTGIVIANQVPSALGTGSVCSTAGVLSAPVSCPIVLVTQAGSPFALVSGNAGSLVVATDASAPTVTLAQSTGALGAGFGVDLFTGAPGATLNITTSRINGGISSLKLGAWQDVAIGADGAGQYLGALSVPQPPTQTGSTFLRDDMTWQAAGSGVTWPATHDVVVSNSTNTPNGAVPSTSGFVLTSNGGAADPTFQALPGATTAVFFAGTASGTANVITVPTTTPGGYTLTDQFHVSFKAIATNTSSAPTLNVNGTGAVVTAVQAGGGLVSLPPGYIVPSQQYDATYQASCPAPVSANCYVVTTTPGSGVVIATTNQAVSATAWANWESIDLKGATTLTVTPVVSTTLSPQGGLFIGAVSGTGTLIATSPDTITSNGVTTGAGGNITLSANTVTKVTTDGDGHLYAVGNTGGAGSTGANPTATIGASAVNGSATTFMRSDAAPAAPAATNAVKGLMEGDGSSITCTAGVCATVGSAAATSDPPQGRLTLTSHTPILSSDVSGALTLYYDAYNGGAYPNYNGTSDVKTTITAGEISDVIGTSGGTGGVLINNVVDEWALAGGVLCHATDGAGHGWSSDTGGSNTARGTGYSQLDNTTRFYTTNKNALANCYNGTTNEGSVAANQATYLGTFWTLKSAGAINMQFKPAGTGGGAAPCLCLFNAYNRVLFNSRSIDSTGWNVSGANAWGVADIGGTGSGLNNRVNWVDGLGVSSMLARYRAAIGNNSDITGGHNVITGINFDSTTATPAGTGSTWFAISIFQTTTMPADDTLAALGAHYAQAMEFSTTGSTGYGFVAGTTPAGVAISLQGAF